MYQKLKLFSLINFCLTVPSLVFGSNVIKIDSGFISGKTQDGIKIYLGIPYAAPPIKNLRWRASEPVKPWPGVKECTKFGSAPPQPIGANIGKTSEDCLYLNVWSPAKKVDEKLPVMVWIHGGGWSVGAASDPIFDGAKYAKKGVVFVSFNYRLGPFGFLVHPELVKESPYHTAGNYGFLDQIAALKWVKKNIAKFGGDPNNVTIFGESAGGLAVSLHLVCPLSKGLFNKVIAQSGGPYGTECMIPETRYEMKKSLLEGEKFVAELECNKAENLVKAMRSKTTDEIMAVYNKYPFSLTPFAPGYKFTPVIDDGYLFSKKPKKLFEENKQADVPIIIGSNADEGTYFYSKLSVEDYQKWLKINFGDKADAVFKMFPAKDQDEVRDVYNQLTTVLMFAEPARFVVQTWQKKKSKSYLYQFSRVGTSKLAQSVGATHGLEVFYVFDCVDKDQPFYYAPFSKTVSFADIIGATVTDENLAQNMMDYWVNFAKNGDPNGKWLPNWPHYEVKSDQNIEFGDKITVKKHLLKKECDFLE